jgi:glycosyltransferase involved in cell wall biosynthesis
VEIVDCPPGGVVPGLDVYACHNSVTYTLEDMQATDDVRLVRYWNDVGPHMHPGVHEWLSTNAEQICCSPVQAQYMGLDGAALIPPPVDLGRFTRAAEAVNGFRPNDAVSVGSWRNYGKAAHKVGEWAELNGHQVDFFGGGPFAPKGSVEVPYDQMPELLARYETFVFLPAVIEPFGRLVAEAWASGCECIVNGLVGSAYWIQDAPEKLDTAAADYWAVVLGT